MIAVIIAGVVVGASYALTGAAFAVAYRSSRILNFSLGGTGGLGAFIAVSLIDAQIPWGVSFIIAVLAGAVIGAIPEILVGRKLMRISPLTAAIGMLGVLLILQGITEYVWGTQGSALPAPYGSTSFQILNGITIQASDIVFVGLAAVGCFGLLWFLYHTPFGLQMRTASVGPVTAETLGIRTRMTGTVGWAINGAFGAAAAVFIGSASTLEPTTYTGFIFLALIALVVGGLSSMWGVMLGGVTFGVILSVMQSQLSTRLTYTFSFIFLCALLLVRPQGLLGRPEMQLNEPSAAIVRRSRLQAALRRVSQRSPAIAAVVSGAGALTVRTERTPTRNMPRTIAGTVVVVAVMLALWWIGPPLISLSLPEVVASFLAVLGLDIMLGYCGQLNLAQGALVGVGAYCGALGVVHLGLPIWMQLPIAAGGGALAGVIVGLPAVRLSHLYYAQVTLLFAFVVPELIQFFGSYTGGSTGFNLPLLKVTLFQQYLLYLLIAGIAVIGVKFALASRLGRHWRAIRDNEAVDRGLGQRTARIKLLAFAVGCGLAGLAGAMQALAIGTISPDAYPVWLSIYYQAALVVGGTTSLLGNLLGAFFVTVVPIYAGTASGGLPPDLIFGVVFVLVMLVAPRGVGYLVSAIWRLLWEFPAHARDVLAQWRSGTGVVLQPVPVTEQPTWAAGDAAASAAPVPPEPVTAAELTVGATSRVSQSAHHGESTDAASPPADAILRVEGLHAGYRGGEVLRSVELTVQTGSIVGVIGPNGAGKSTLLRCVTGLLPPTAGKVWYEGKNIVGVPAFRIARSGIAHVVEGRGIFPNLTVRENLWLGRLHRYEADGDSAPSLTADWIFELFPILTSREKQLAGQLSGGEQQMLAIARSLLMQPRCLILDEPLLGLSPVVGDQVIDRLRQIRAAGVSVLLVEQNVYQAMSLCDFTYVLASGRVIAQGTPQELAANNDLLESYFGLTKGSVPAR